MHKALRAILWVGCYEIKVELGGGSVAAAAGGLCAKPQRGGRGVIGRCGGGGVLSQRWN